MNTSGEELIDVYADSSMFTTPNITPNKNGNGIQDINIDESDKIPTSMDENMNEELDFEDEDDMESDEEDNSDMEDLTS